MATPIHVMFVEEGLRLSNEGRLIEAIVRLKNACYCHSLDPAYVEQLDEIIDTISREIRFGKGKR